MATCKLCGNNYSIWTARALRQGICNKCADDAKYADVNEFSCWILDGDPRMSANEANEIYEDKLLEKLKVKAKGVIKEEKFVVYRELRIVAELPREKIHRVTYESLKKRSWLYGFFEAFGFLGAMLASLFRVGPPRQMLAIYF